MFDPMYSFFMTHGDTISKIILNTIFVSMPEEIYVVMFTLILTGEFDYWQFKGYKKLINKGDWSKILIPSTVFAIMSNIFRYTGLNHGIYSIIPFIIMFILIILTNEILKDGNPSRWIKRTLLIYIIAILSVGLSELIFIPIILYATNMTMVEINNNILLNFLVSLPAKTIQYLVLIHFIIKKRTYLKGNILKLFSIGRTLSNLFIFIVFLNLGFLAIMYNMIIYNKALDHFSYIYKSIIIIGVLIVPILNIIGFIWGIYYVHNKALIKNKNTSDSIEKLLNDLTTYTNSKKYETIEWKLNEISSQIQFISKQLYK